MGGSETYDLPLEGLLKDNKLPCWVGCWTAGSSESVPDWPENHPVMFSAEFPRESTVGTPPGQCNIAEADPTAGEVPSMVFEVRRQVDLEVSEYLDKEVPPLPVPRPRLGGRPPDFLDVKPPPWDKRP